MDDKQTEPTEQTDDSEGIDLEDEPNGIEMDSSSPSVMLSPSELNLPTLSVLINDVSELAQYRPRVITNAESRAKTHWEANDVAIPSEETDGMEWELALRPVGLEFSDMVSENETSWTIHATHGVTNRNLRLRISKRPTSGALEARFASRAREIGTLKHAGIPEMLLCGNLNGKFPYYATETMAGHSLEEMLPGLHMPGSSIRWRRGNGAIILQYVLDAVHAVGYAHSQGVGHGAIQPSNLLVSKANQKLQVTDWGILRSLTASTEDSTEDSTDQAYVQEDLNLLGTTLFRMVYNSIPTNTPGGPVFPTIEQTNVPLELAAIVRKSMQGDLAEGYQSLHDFADDIERFLKNQPVLAYKESLSKLHRISYSIQKLTKLWT